MNLRTALANIHNDPWWWRKVLAAGFLSMTIFGMPWSAGLVAESFDNVRKGYPTPLPPRAEFITRYIIGLFALMVDVVFFVLPVFIISIGMLVLALLLTLGSVSSLSIVFVVGGAVWALYELGAFVLSLSPVGRLLYVREGFPEQALSFQATRVALRPDLRRLYGRARLLSLPAYLPALLLGGAAWYVGSRNLPLTLIVLWLVFSALTYAHLVVAQLYGDIEREQPI